MSGLPKRSSIEARQAVEMLLLLQDSKPGLVFTWVWNVLGKAKVSISLSKCATPVYDTER
jgi:hypothetical protein